MKGSTMNLRKIAVLGSFAAGAALALAPQAAADDLTSTVDSEITSLNALFTSEATLAGDSSDIIQPTAGQPFDTISLTEAPDSGTPTTLDYELYGLNPIANAASDPGAYNVLNGALVEFDDAYNVELYSLLNGGDLIPQADVANDLFGSAGTIADALDTGTVTGAVGAFLTDGWSDLLGYL
jgi:hypothetical protein